MIKSPITTIVKAGSAGVMAAVMAAGLLGTPAFAAPGTTGESTIAGAACRNISGSPKGAANADISVRVCWHPRKRVTWTAYFYPRGTRIALEGTVVRKGVVSTYKSRTRVSYSTARGTYRKVDHVWFKACKVRGNVFYACAAIR
ncbi:hypothetical protein ETD86_01730 [Nonomuraea turkmeniaca]|uniref:Ig-like domain-containing protein n=1 Tax=Nonomuraea turkmeniaca TaxID=103838 RepID=A0A5S4FX95_9ACTN|nr:hypothetical protein [Nonomuraea turkmeniaca]TMR25333.1 hypothetical protein ETD86_01730 [Nonomuraea turkmeniaca]